MFCFCLDFALSDEGCVFMFHARHFKTMISPLIDLCEMMMMINLYYRDDCILCNECIRNVHIMANTETQFVSM